jgi:diaminopimelate epimerase
MHGCGNDYVYIDGGKEHIPQEKKSELAIKISDRHFGIGSDGLIFINPMQGEDADFEMEMYNADGSRSEMCGNGIRCVAKYVYDHRLTDKKNLTIVSAGKNKYIELTVDDNNLVSWVKVDMGAPILAPEQIPVRLPSPVTDVPITVAGKEYRMTCVSMGNPHAVVVLPDDTDLGAFDIEKTGPLFESHEYFPNRVNTEFVTIDDRSSVHMRVWERGTGETLACGTGCCATVTACILNGLTDKKVTVHVLGGDVVCSWDGDENSPVIMEGPAATVFEGTIDIDI